MDKSTTVVLRNVEGYKRRLNDLVFCGSEGQQHVVFFPGDVQNYADEMDKNWKKWDLETTAKLLDKRFPNSFIWVVRPSWYHMKTFSCYNNFVESNLFGVPDHRNTEYGALLHLKALIRSGVNQVLDILESEEDVTSEFPIIIVGFSKGCCVLNQIVHELSGVNPNVDSDLNDFVARISVMYWLDGGHSGEANTWITDEKYLYYLAKYIPSIKVHVTPYQIKDRTRPWIGKEEKTFVEKLKALGANVKVKVHFEDKDASLFYHFKLIESF